MTARHGPQVSATEPTRRLALAALASVAAVTLIGCELVCPPNCTLGLPRTALDDCYAAEAAIQDAMATCGLDDDFELFCDDWAPMMNCQSASDYFTCFADEYNQWAVDCDWESFTFDCVWVGC